MGSPHDPEARYADTGGTTGVGYKAPLTETGEDKTLRLLTQGEPTLAPVPEHAVLDERPHPLAAKALLPREHWGDGGSLKAELLVHRQQDYGGGLCGPARPDTAWQAHAGTGVAATDFTCDWAQRQARGPGGQTRSSGHAATARYGQAQLKITFAVRHGQPCAPRPDCTRIARRGF